MSSSGSSSRTSSHNKAAIRKYRFNNLKRAGIFVDSLDRSEWPPSISELADYLKNHNFTETLSKEEAVRLNGAVGLVDIPLQAIRPDDAATKPLGSRGALSRSLSITGPRVKSYYGKQETTWMLLVEDVMSDATNCGELGQSRNELWDEPIGPLSGELDPVSTPKPDLAYGLLPQSVTGDETADLPIQAPPLSDEFLLAAKILFGLHAWPSDSLRDVAYPCLILEAKSDSNPLYHAENQAAGGAAKALIMLRSLREIHKQCVPAAAAVSTMQQDPLLPVLVFCTSGDLWEVMIAFEYPTNRKFRQADVHLVQIWMGKICVPWCMFQLHFIIQRSLHWIKTVFRVRVEQALEDLRRTLQERQAVPADPATTIEP